MRRRRAALGALAIGALGSLGCGDDGDCGPGDAPADGLVVDTGDTQLTFGTGTSSPNNDCPPQPPIDGAPTSLTVEIRQVDPPTAMPRFFVLCLPRPDQIGDAAIDITDDSLVQVIDIFADEADCLISIDRARAVSGTATFSGFCDDGTNAAGYALALDATIPATRTCDGADEAIDLTLSGSVALESLSL